MKKIVFSLDILAFSFTLYFNFQVSSIDRGSDITLSNVGKVAFATSECEQEGGWYHMDEVYISNGIICKSEKFDCCLISWNQ